MLVKLEDGIPSKWPVTAAMLKHENPNISFPSDLTGINISEYGFALFQHSDPDEYNAIYQTVEEVAPTLVDGVYVQSWSISDIYTSDERTALEEAEAAQLLIIRAEEHRGQREELLARSDWTQVADAPVDATAWATYRQALRDLPTHSNWPNLEDADWPNKPN